MSQIRISRDLGPLPRGSVLRATHNKTDELRQALRTLAIKNQREQSRVFYSLREVARQFRVPVSTVANVYRDMEQEGLLSRVRGSKTVLNGLRANRRLSIRGLIGLPTIIANFLTIPEYRAFFFCIRRELWLRGFATTMFFCRPNEATEGTLLDQFKSYEVDSVIWLHPGRALRDTLLRLSDMGIRVIVISQIGTPGMPSRYYAWKERALTKLLTEWKYQGSVRKITVVDSKYYRSPVTEELLRFISQNLRLELAIRTFQHQDVSGFLRDLCDVKTDRIIFPCAGLASMFAFRSPDELAHLLKTHRVAFVDGPIDMPFAKVPDVLIDLVAINWQAVAESIVSDLVTHNAFDRDRHTTFEAEAHSRVSLKSVCEEMPARGIWALE